MKKCCSSKVQIGLSLGSDWPLMAAGVFKVTSCHNRIHKAKLSHPVTPTPHPPSSNYKCLGRTESAWVMNCFLLLQSEEMTRPCRGRSDHLCLGRCRCNIVRDEIHTETLQKPEWHRAVKRVFSYHNFCQFSGFSLRCSTTERDQWETLSEHMKTHLLSLLKLYWMKWCGFTQTLIILGLGSDAKMRTENIVLSLLLLFIINIITRMCTKLLNKMVETLNSDERNEPFIETSRSKQFFLPPAVKMILMHKSFISSKDSRLNTDSVTNRATIVLNKNKYYDWKVWKHELHILLSMTWYKQAIKCVQMSNKGLI